MQKNVLRAQGCQDDDNVVTDEMNAAGQDQLTRARAKCNAS